MTRVDMDKIQKVGTCQAGLCHNQALSVISLDTLTIDPDTLQACAIPKAVNVCIKHKSQYIKYQEKVLDRINPRRKHGVANR